MLICAPKVHLQKLSCCSILWAFSLLVNSSTSCGLRHFFPACSNGLGSLFACSTGSCSVQVCVDSKSLGFGVAKRVRNRQRDHEDCNGFHTCTGGDDLSVNGQAVCASCVRELHSQQLLHDLPHGLHLLRQAEHGQPDGQLPAVPGQLGGFAGRGLLRGDERSGVLPHGLHLRRDFLPARHRELHKSFAAGEFVWDPNRSVHGVPTVPRPTHGGVSCWWSGEEIQSCQSRCHCTGSDPVSSSCGGSRSYHHYRAEETETGQGHS